MWYELTISLMRIGIITSLRAYDGVEKQTLPKRSKNTEIKQARKKWKKTYDKWIRDTKIKDKAPKTTPSKIPLKSIYDPTDIEDFDYLKKLGFPGIYPFTRGVYPTMYRGRPWTVRLLSGFGTGEDANERFKFLVKEGETGLNLALDSPTIYGFDADDPRMRGEVGQGGASISSIEALERIFKDLPIGRLSTSVVTHFLGLPTYAMYIAMADKQGIPRKNLRGTTQNDPLWLFHVGNPPLPLKPSVKLAVDLQEFCMKHTPKWYGINVSGYHIREAGSNAIQEAVFTLADATVFIDETLSRGWHIDDIAPQISFFMNAYNNLFEEIAKFRAMRRVWAKILKERYGAKKARSLIFKFHTQTGGSALTAQEPLNNIVRATIHSLAAIIGGTQSLHTDSYDEALGLPTEAAAKLALRTQHIIYHESGVPNVIDPLGGSYYVEWLTDQVEEEIWRYFDRIDKAGGMLAYTEAGIPRREISQTSYQTQLAIERGDIPIVGVNLFKSKIGDFEVCRVKLEQEDAEIDAVKRVKKNRNQKAVEETLGEFRKACKKGVNVTPFAIKAAKANVTNGEMYQVFWDVYGEWPHLD
jgi:methylmalonyl-CoA mutase N-terminal domain/subunit